MIKFLQRWQTKREQTHNFNSHSFLDSQKHNHCKACGIHLSKFADISCNVVRHTDIPQVEKDPIKP